MGWLSVKNRAALSMRWATWSWSSWNNPRRLLNVLLAWSTYLRAWPCVNVASCDDPVEVRWAESEQHSKHWKPSTIVLHQPSQEERNVVRIPGNKTIMKPEIRLYVQRRKTSTLRYGIGGRETKSIEHLNSHIIGPTSGSSYLDYIPHFDISHDALQWQRARYNNMVHLRSLDSNKQAGPLCERRGCKEATRALMNLQYAERQGEPKIPLTSRTRQNNTMDPEVQVFTGWSTLRNRKIQNANNHSSLSSSWSPSPTWWNSSSWDHQWQEWHSHGWQDKEWWDKR